MDNGDQILRRYRSDIHSMCASFPEPATSYKIRMEFDDNFGDEVPFRQFGYPSLDAFLNDHPDLDKVMHDGKTCYRAKVTAATVEIQALIARQKKKKKNRGAQGKKNRGNGLHRNNLNRYRQINPQGLIPPSRTSNRGAKSFNFLDRQGPPGLSRVYSGPTSTDPSLWKMSSPKAPYHTQSNVPPLTRPASSGHLNAPRPPVENTGPDVGVQRLLRALDKCNGKATLTKLNWAYTILFNVELDGREMKRHFGTNNMGIIHRQYLRDKVEFNPGYNGQWSFLSTENAQKKKDWDQHHKDAIIEAPRYTWSYPTIKELYDKTVDILVNMYPETIPLTSVAEYYKRTHSVLVDPQALYCKGWEDLVKTTFADRLILTDDKRVALSKKFAQLRLLSSQTTGVHRSTSTVKRVTADSLDLIYLADSDEGDSEDYDLGDSEDDSITAKLSETKQSSLTFPPGLAVPASSRHQFPDMASFFIDMPTKTVVPERRSIFDRMTLPPKPEVPTVRKEQQKTQGGSVFDKTSLDVKLPFGFPVMESSVFNRKPLTPIRVPAPDPTVNELAAKMEKHVALGKRMDDFEALLEKERARDQMTGFGFSGRETKKYEENKRKGSIFQQAAEILDRKVPTPIERYQLPHTESPHLKRLDCSAPMTVSPGNYNVKLNGRSETLKSMIQSRRQHNSDSSGEAW